MENAMRTGTLMSSSAAAALLFCVAGPGAAQPAARPTAWAPVEHALGRPGALQPDGTLRFSFPRSDLQVTVDGLRLRPAFALGSWVAIRRLSDGSAMAMGDLVLSEDEVGPVMSRLQQGGVQQTALHNHLLRESPRVMYMHVEGHGDPVRIAETVRAALALSHTPLGTPSPLPAGVAIDLDTAAVARALGRSGRVNGGVYQVSVPRRETIREGTAEIPASMGTATAINFQPTGDGRAAITGDFVMTASEVNPVIHLLRSGGIEVTALHSHMVAEQPRLFFMHFWADDDALKLARALRAALARMNVR
jgi:hypothetical protein